MKLKISHPLLNQAVGLLGSTLLWAHAHTLDSKAAHFDRRVDPLHPRRITPAIYVFWHEYILHPLVNRAHTGTTILVSGHRDGQYLSHIARRLGSKSVFGSTSRNGVAALKHLLTHNRGPIAITPDGPRGPRRECAPGAIFLAAKLGLPLIALGVGYDRPWRLKTWDRFAIPRPGSRARAVFGPAFQLPKRLGRDGLEYWRLKVQQHLNDLTQFAEDWAASGDCVAGEMSFYPRHFPYKGLFNQSDLVDIGDGSPGTSREKAA